jgi:hypothetical protein
VLWASRWGGFFSISGFFAAYWLKVHQFGVRNSATLFFLSSAVRKGDFKTALA